MNHDRAGLGFVIAALLAAACDVPAKASERDAAIRMGSPVDPPAAPEVRLPADEGPWFPSLARLAPGENTADVALLADVATCAQCHAEAAAQHAVSAHARSSFDNPWYRAVVDRLREEVGYRASRHCAGCHDPLLLFSGRMDRPIDPSDPETARLAAAGITCAVCHGIVETRSEGNGSYTLTTRPIPIPDPNDPEQVAAHRARVAAPVLRTPGLCGSCHRGFLGPHTGGAHFLPGIDEIGPWRGSVWGGQQAQRIDDVEVSDRGCRSCHMPKQRVTGLELGAPDGFLASHRFAGGHSAIAAAVGDRAQLDAVRVLQSTAASIDVTALRYEDGRRALPIDGAPVRPGERVTIDVVVRNIGTGHRFPGGARDVRDHWVEVRVRDARGRVVASAGTDHAHNEDPTAYVLRTAVLDENGVPDRGHLVHRFRALGWDHTIGPRDALAIRYAFHAPEDAAMPLAIEATLRARRHHAGLLALACEASRNPRGRAFDEAARALGKAPIDGCAEEPIFDLAVARTVIGGPAPEAARPIWERLYDHALALSHELQERLDDARPSIEAALVWLERAGYDDPRARTRLELLLAEIAARQGRRAEADALCDRIEAQIGPHPAIDRVRGRAAAQVWDWAAAARAFARVAELAPLDTEAHRDVARALGSLGRPREALVAAVQGLALLPWDESLLRTEALALGALGDVRAEAATAAWLQYRRADAETELRLRCDAIVPGCARDRLPIATIDLD
jgi:tetratricopeptide (TPR) repeat protein